MPDETRLNLVDQIEPLIHEIRGTANLAWVQHFIHHFSTSGFAFFVLASGSLCSNQLGEEDIYRKLQLGGDTTKLTSVDM